MRSDFQHRQMFVSVNIAVLSFMLCSFPHEALSQGEVTVESILDRWKSREERAPTLTFDWRLTRTHAAGSLPSSGRGQPATSQSESTPAPTPPNDVTHQYQCALSLDGKLMRYSHNGPQWLADQNTFFQRTYTSVFDGKESKSYFSQAVPDPEGRGLQQCGFVMATKYCGDVADYNIWPILFTYRAVDSEMSRLSGDAWTLTGETAFVRGRNCAVLSNTKNSRTKRCWVDVERECSVMRYDLMVRGKLRLRLDIDYTQNNNAAWAPTRWNVDVFFPESVRIEESSFAEVNEYRIGTEFDSNAFRFDFPPGTQVSDTKSDVKYLILKDGSRRIITKDELLRGATYKDFVLTESGMAGLPATKSWMKSAWALVGLVIMAALLLFFLSRRAFSFSTNTHS